METLADRIAREGPVNELDAVGWIVRLAKKLEMLHSRGLAHGGISPEAIKTASASRLSLGMLVPMGAVRNRLEFRSPERLGGEQSSVSDDAWSTAATLYVLLTGSSPFVGGDDDATRQKIRSGAFSPLSSLEVGDEDLQHIIEGALNASIKNRTSTIAAFREALEGWHPDPKVRELPPLADDQPDEDDEDERTVMRQVDASDAVRAIVAQRDLASMRPPEPTLPSVNETAARTPAPPVAPPQAPPVAPPPVAHAHGLMEDDDENAKTSLISIPPQAYLAALARGPATVPAPPPPGTVRSAPPVQTTSATGFDLQRAPGGLAARAPAAMRPAAGAAAVAPPVGISRDAFIDDGDGEATVMREAPVELLRQAKSSIAPPALDRQTPVDPTSAAVAAADAAPVKETAAAASMSSLFDDETSDKPSPPAPAAPAQTATDDEELNATVAMASHVSDPGPAPGRASSIPNPSPIARVSVPTPAPIVPNSPPVAQLAQPAPIVPTNELAQASPVKGLLIGMGLALALLAALAAAYFFVLKP